MGAWKDNIREEIKHGGSEAACPFCRIPRVRRSDYIRCCNCGVNWMNGEMLDSDPRAQRMNKFLASAAATAISKKKES